MTLSVKASYIPRGFSFSSVACGLKKSGLDLGLFVSETPAVAAAMFTTNRVQAAPVRLSQSHLRRSRRNMRAVVVNSGNANCCTGSSGYAASEVTSRKVSQELADARSFADSGVLNRRDWPAAARREDPEGGARLGPRAKRQS